MQTVHNFITGFTEGNAQQIIDSLGPNIIMVGSDESHLEAHMFLKGDAIAEWAQGMLDEAGPHTNKYEVVSTSERMSAMIVITKETGSNKFRTWENQRVTYMLGDFDGQWKILTYSIG